ncbi:nephrocystin-1 [Chanos chanos]|uniref:Nephrocystin-1 n=1 Tax=Chanos chanos TaxID=29144 RepID=A0A6J2WGE2_CHACN|nr:nephrocystin-1 [Chanos chanos]
MPPKRRGPLQTVQRDTDDIKKKIDALSSGIDGLNEAERREASLRCSELQNAVEQRKRTLQKLTKADEPAPVANYNQRKQDEEERLLRLQEHLHTLALKLQPIESKNESEAGQSSIQEDEESGEEESEENEESADSDNVDDDDDEEEEDEEGDNDDEDIDTERKTAAVYIALSTFKGEQEGDLSMQKGEVLTILKKNMDGWWLGQDSKGNQGLVPRTFLKEYSGEEKEEESEVEENSADEEEEEPKAKQSASSNWDTVRRAITEIDATDVLSAMGAIPPGFRPSTLSKLLDEGITHRGSHYTQPELSQSQLSFNDLFLDPDSGKVRLRQSRVCLTLTLWSCRMIPPPGVGLQVLSRHIRFCAFNGTEVLSNVHTVRATYNPKSPKTWRFSPRMSGVLPSLLDGDCFLRCHSPSPNLGILFELGVTYIRNSTGERGDLSCGWAFLKLFDKNGTPIPLRTQELTVHGGTPYERDVEMDTTSTKRASATPTGVLQQMLMARKLPKLLVKLKSPSTRIRTLLNLLPDTIVGSLSCVPLLALYRQLLADTLLLNRVTMQNADLLCSSVLATFPQVLDQPDLMDALRLAWMKAESMLKRHEKNDIAVLKREFENVYMSSVYPLLFMTEMPRPQWADEGVETQRARVIYNPALQNPMATMLSSEHTHQAFDITQVTYDLISSARH